MLESLFNYPILTTGLVMAPRGITSAIAMVFCAPLMKVIDHRWIIAAGIILEGIGSYMMAHYNLNAGMTAMIIPTAIQGFGIGLFMVPLSTYPFSYLPKNETAQAAGIYSFGRSLGSSIGISLLGTVFTRETQTNWNVLGGHIQATSAALHHWLFVKQMTLHTPSAIQKLGSMLSKQSSMIAFNDSFWIAAITTFALLPLVLLLKKAK